METQTIIAIAIVAVSAGIVIWRAIRALTGRRDCGCGSCSGGKTDRRKQEEASAPKDGQQP
jgi:hypothetical protein